MRVTTNSVKETMKRIVLLLAVAGSAACSQLVESPVAGSGIIHLTTDIEPLTRISMDQTGKGSFSTGDRLQLTISGASTENRIEEYTLGTTALYWEDLGFATSTQQVRFAGCYPALTEGSGTIREFNVATADEPDLLLAQAVSVERGTASVVNLTFRHAMHRLRITYTTTGDYTREELQQITTNCKAKTSCKVDLANGSVYQTLSTVSALTPATATDAATFLLPPQASADVTLTVALANKSLEINLAQWLSDAGQAQQTLEGGKELQLTIRVGKEGISFGGMEIVGWGSQGSVEGDIIL